MGQGASGGQQVSDLLAHMLLGESIARSGDGEHTDNLPAMTEDGGRYRGTVRIGFTKRDRIAFSPDVASDVGR